MAEQNIAPPPNKDISPTIRTDIDNKITVISTDELHSEMPPITRISPTTIIRKETIPFIIYLISSPYKHHIILNTIHLTS